MSNSILFFEYYSDSSNTSNDDTSNNISNNFDNFFSEEEIDEETHQEYKSDDCEVQGINDEQDSDTEYNNGECVNYNICKNMIFSFNNRYCKECFLYFNRKLNINLNKESKTCPLCLSNEKNNNIINLYTCNHIICESCLYNIYWKYEHHKITFPYINLKELWEEYIKSNLSRRLKSFVIYKLVNSDLEYFNDDYDIYMRNINLKNIPKIFVNKLKELIYYQSQIEKYQININKIKYEMRTSIRNCAFCRAVRK